MSTVPIRTKSADRLLNVVTDVAQAVKNAGIVIPGGTTAEQLPQIVGENLMRKDDGSDAPALRIYGAGTRDRVEIPIHPWADYPWWNDWENEWWTMRTVMASGWDNAIFSGLTAEHFRDNWGNEITPGDRWISDSWNRPAIVISEIRNMSGGYNIGYIKARYARGFDDTPVLNYFVTSWSGGTSNSSVLADGDIVFTPVLVYARNPNITEGIIPSRISRNTDPTHEIIHRSRPRVVDVQPPRTGSLGQFTHTLRTRIVAANPDGQGMRTCLLIETAERNG